VTKPPAPRPCESCPYRRDVAPGVWAEEEYAKLPGFDGETWEQTPAVFYCHRQDGKLCAGWAGCHDMAESFGLRLLAATLDAETLDAVLDYTTDVPLFTSGAEAAAHGRSGIESPPPEAVRLIQKLERQIPRKGG
jgi:Family of unknown function (DUF6283)